MVSCLMTLGFHPYFFFTHEVILLSSINSELKPSADTGDGLHLSATLPG